MILIDLIQIESRYANCFEMHCLNLDYYGSVWSCFAMIWCEGVCHDMIFM